MRSLSTLAMMALAMGFCIPFPERKEVESKPLTDADKERIEAAKRKRERKAKRMKGGV